MVTVQQTPDLRTRQIALEEESLTLGIDRYQKERGRQDEADTGPGRRLIRDTIGPVAAAIDVFVAEARNGKPGKKHTAVRWAEKFPASELAYLTVRHCLNAISSKDTRVQTVAEGIAVAVEDSINYSRFREESPRSIQAPPRRPQKEHVPTALPQCDVGSHATYRSGSVRVPRPRRHPLRHEDGRAVH